MQVATNNSKSTSQAEVKKKMKKIPKCSHLYLEEKYLKEIPKLSSSKNTIVIYLFKNNVENIDNLNGFPNLTSLYLQQNLISKLENLQRLTKLKKLYIGNNRISVLEGLEALSNLEELHIEKQELSEGVPLCIDPRTIQAISETLSILNISHNRITSLKVLTPLRKLRYLDASHNDLDDIKDICETLRYWYFLREAIFTGNSFTKKHRYREDIIANTLKLESLDGKRVSEVSRRFLKILEQQKITKGSKQSINLAASVPGLPKHLPSSLEKAVSTSLLRHTLIKSSEEHIFNEQDAQFITWRALPKRKQHIKTPKSLRRNIIQRQDIVDSLQILRK